MSLDFCKVNSNDLSAISKWVDTETLFFVGHRAALDLQDASLHVGDSISPELGNCRTCQAVNAKPPLV